MNPVFGVGIRDLIFENEVDKESLKNIIITSAQRFIPEIEILEVNVGRVSRDTSPELHQLRISITYALISNNQTDAVELNFY